MKNVILAIVIFLSGFSIETSFATEVESKTYLKDSLPTKHPYEITYSKPIDGSAYHFDCNNGSTAFSAEPDSHSIFILHNEHQIKSLNPKRPIALKSNLLCWLVATPNVSVEFYLSKRLSLSTELDFAWWSNSASQLYWQIFSVSPELRYWFCNDRPFHGHYAGVYVGGGIYDIMFKPITGHKGYQAHYILSAGLNYGYVFPIGKHFSLEAGIGIGYMVTNYLEYVWSCSKYMHTDTKRTTWIGPTKINLTLVWQIPR